MQVSQRLSYIAAYPVTLTGGTRTLAKRLRSARDGLNSPTVSCVTGWRSNCDLTIRKKRYGRERESGTRAALSYIGKRSMRTFTFSSQ